MFHFSHLRLQRRQAASLCSVTTVKYSIRVAQHWCSDLASFATKPIALCRRAHTMPTPVTETACVAGVRKMVDDIVVSANDKRKYRGLELDNGMTVLVVHDENATKAAAALDVRVGGYHDPEGLPGLAHFCEHMLFLGTKKYPVENDYQKFIESHGGSCNAMTSEQDTKYYFDVAVDQLEPALDRFAQFFISPLFNDDMTEREVNAVNSEFEEYIHQDSWRINHVYSETCDPSHPHAKFYVGNISTLSAVPKQKGVDVRDALLAYHDKYYSANIMTLAVLGKESLDELTAIVVDRFSEIRNHNVDMKPPAKLPFRAEDLGIEVKIVPIKDQRMLSMQFPMRDFSADYKYIPAHYVADLIGHEGKGSLLSLLKSKGYCNCLEAGATGVTRGFDQFEISVDLTEDGLEHVDEIIECAYQYIAMLRKTGPLEWYYDELADICTMWFRFQNNSEPIRLVSSITERMQDYPIRDCLCLGLLAEKFRPDLIEEVLSYLTPENMRLQIISKKFEGQTTKKEVWFGADYSVERISDARRQAWREVEAHPEFHIPSPNEFIPKNFDLKSNADTSVKVPVQILNTLLTSAWYKPDTSFFLPKACIAFRIVTNVIYESQASSLYSSLLVRLFHDAMAEYIYPANRCEINFQVRSESRAIVMVVAGYNDKLSTFMKTVFPKLLTFEPTEDRFAIFKEELVRELQNHAAESPYVHASQLGSHLTDHRSYLVPELIPFAKDLTCEGLAAFAKTLYPTCKVDLLAEGNITKEETISLGRWVEDKLVEVWKSEPLTQDNMWFHQQHKLPSGCNFLHTAINEVHNSSCVEVYYQIGEQSIPANALLLILNQLMTERFFSALRTKRQLGYIVGSSAARSDGIQGYRLFVQSEKEPAEVERCMEAFLLEFEDTLVSLSEEDYQEAVAAVVVRLQQKPKTIYSELTQHWTEIVSHRFGFNIRELCATATSAVKKQDVLDFFQEHISPKSASRRKYSIHIKPKEGVELGGVGDAPDGPVLTAPEVIDDIPSFKSALPLYKRVMPMIDIPPPGADV